MEWHAWSSLCIMQLHGFMPCTTLWYSMPQFVLLLLFVPMAVLKMAWSCEEYEVSKGSLFSWISTKHKNLRLEQLFVFQYFGSIMGRVVFIVLWSYLRISLYFNIMTHVSHIIEFILWCIVNSVLVLSFMSFRFPNAASKVPYDSIHRTSPSSKTSLPGAGRKQAPGEISPQRVAAREIYVRKLYKLP